MGICLDPRLLAVASLVEKGTTVADIGTDHGYLVCYLLKNNICTHAYACDLNQAPLNVARKNVEKHSLQNICDFILADGLNGISEDSADVIVIAGMGGDLIHRILTSVPWTATSTKTFILQPMTKQSRLRTLLSSSGFAIEKEVSAVSGRFTYTAMRVVSQLSVKN